MNCGGHRGPDDCGMGVEHVADAFGLLLRAKVSGMGIGNSDYSVNIGSFLLLSACARERAGSWGWGGVLSGDARVFQLLSYSLGFLLL